MPTPFRPTALSALLVALLVPLAACSDSLGAPGVGSSAQTTDALGILPADAQVVGMMDLEAARESDALLAVTGESGLGMVSRSGGDDFDEFVRMTGFDPAEDLDRVYLAGADVDGRSRNPMAFVAYGRFDRDRIEQYLANQDEAEFETSQVDGVPVYITADEDGQRGGFALVNDQMTIAGDEATLRAMLGRVGGAGVSPEPALQALFDRVAHQGAWFVARGLDAVTAEVPNDAPPAALAMRAAEAIVVSMDFQSDGVPVTAFVKAQDGTDTDDLADVLRGGLSAAKIGLKDNPALFDVVDRAEVDARADGVSVSGFLTTEFLATMRQGAEARAVVHDAR